MFEAERLIVIGNGFDMSSGLNSGFKSFFKSKEMKQENEIVENLLERFDSLNSDWPERLSGVREKLWRDSISDLQGYETGNFTFWDIWFLIQKHQHENLDNWADVEYQLSEFLIPQSKYARHAADVTGEPESLFDKVENMINSWQRAYSGKMGDFKNDAEIMMSVSITYTKQDRMVRLLSEIICILFEYGRL